MKTSPQELKDGLTARMLAPNPESIPARARETQIPKDTLYGWRGAALGRVPYHLSVPHDGADPVEGG